MRQESTSCDISPQYYLNVMWLTSRNAFQIELSARLLRLSLRCARANIRDPRRNAYGPRKDAVRGCISADADIRPVRKSAVFPPLHAS